MNRIGKANRENRNGKTRATAGHLRDSLRCATCVLQLKSTCYTWSIPSTMSQPTQTQSPHLIMIPTSYHDVFHIMSWCVSHHSMKVLTSTTSHLHMMCFTACQDEFQKLNIMIYISNKMCFTRIESRGRADGHFKLPFKRNG